MIKILLCCASGMSTSLLVEKMKRAATKQNVEAEIWAVNAENTDLKDVEADIIFLGPQVRYAKEEIQNCWFYSSIYDWYEGLWYDEW